MRMDALISEADTKSIDADYQRKRLALRRIQAELSGAPFKTEANDPARLAPILFR
jgi:HlyD family secretion protein